MFPTYRCYASTSNSLKINADASVIEGADSVKVGLVVCDDKGSVHGAYSRWIRHNFGVFVAEYIAIREG